MFFGLFFFLLLAGSLLVAIVALSVASFAGGIKNCGSVDSVSQPSQYFPSAGG